MLMTSDRVSWSALLDPVTVLPRNTHSGFAGLNSFPQCALFPPDSVLLVEGQQATQQVHVAVLVLLPARQVQDSVVLAIAIFVKPTIRIVE